MQTEDTATIIGQHNARLTGGDELFEGTTHVGVLCREPVLAVGEEDLRPLLVSATATAREAIETLSAALGAMAISQSPRAQTAAAIAYDTIDRLRESVRS